MKVHEIIKNAVLACGSSDVTEYSDFSMSFLNNVLSEIHTKNNIVRQGKGLDGYSNIMRVKNQDDDIPCEQEFYTALVYGLASRLLIGDGDVDDGRHITYQSLYESEVNRAVVAVEHPIEDVYYGQY